MRPNNIIEQIKEDHPDDMFIKLDGLDDCIVGYEEKGGRLVYDIDKIIKLLQTRDGMHYFEAVEFYDFNIEGAYMGETTPLFIKQYESR